MTILQQEYYVLAVDLPGIGASGELAAQDKKTMAAFVHDLLLQEQLKEPVVAGHDVGGMVTYAAIKFFPQLISKAIIMNTAIPGVEPWEAVKQNPYIWHFAFYAVPGLPELLIDGKQRALFDYFYDTLAADKKLIPEENRNLYAQAYAKTGVKTSLGWYRAFPQDERDNAPVQPVATPVLYIRGDKDPGKIDDYLSGFQKNGLSDITGKLVANSGHFSPEEAPAEVARYIREFI